MTGTAAIEHYLGEVADRLPGSARARSRIIAELRAGLLDATDAHRSAGLPPTEAATAAVREFGDPGLVADGFRPEIAAGLARRVSIAVLATGPIVGLLWIATAATSHLMSRLEWASLPTVLQAVLALTAVAAGVTACGALLGIAVTGRLTRWVPVQPRRAPAAAAIAGFGAIGADALGLALLAVGLAIFPGKLSPVPAAVAAAASIVRILLARRAARHCLAARRELGLTVCP